MDEINKQVLKMYARARDDFQKMRKTMDNRIGRKADGSTQNIDERVMDVADFENFKSIADSARKQEKEIEKMLEKKLKTIGFYNDWLVKVRGIGPVLAGWILGTFDIKIATTVSKMWMYSGLNPGLIRGKKSIKADKYKESMGRVIGEKETPKGKNYIIETNDMVRGDRVRKDYLSPFNIELKSILIGRLATSFIRGGSKYRKFYDDRKNRRKNSDSAIINDSDKNRQDDWKKWNEVSDGHRDMDAKRYMVKMFLIDLYVAWRKHEGLPVREPYSNEYLGKTHDAA